MDTIRKNDSGAGVADVQRKLSKLGYLPEGEPSGTFDDATEAAVNAFCADCGLERLGVVNQVVWSRLVDASFDLGDRNLFLRVPFFHGHDVETLQSALSILGFPTNGVDGIFGAHTEEALRRFQMNMGLPSDGICGSLTFRAINNLSHSWKDKASLSPLPNMGFARAASVLDSHYLVLFGTTDFARSVAARMSNLALATSPSSRVVSADSLSVVPESGALFVHVLSSNQEPTNYPEPIVEYDPDETLGLRLSQALRVVSPEHSRIALRLPGETWDKAGEARSAQHFAIVLLDALCSALAVLDEEN